MATSDRGAVTELLVAWGQGDRDALDRLVPLVYGELKRLAGSYLSHERQGHTLETSGLVNEAYLRLVGQQRAQWNNRSQFFAVAATQMRRVLVDHARRRTAALRGGGLRVTLDESAAPAALRAVEVLEIEQALSRLETFDARQGRIVELRYFTGLTIDETAAALGLSAATVKREWALARAWLRRELEGNAGDGS